MAGHQVFCLAYSGMSVKVQGLGLRGPEGLGFTLNLDP